MSDNEKRIKVTDKRMFTSEGELRQEFIGAGSSQAPAKTEKTVAEEVSRPAPPAAKSSSTGAPLAGQVAPSGEPSKAPAAPEAELASGAVFQDLVALLGQTASVYLRQASQQLGQRAEHLEMARLHIDLLSVLKEKTQGNLKAEESSMLEDAIYQLRMAFVEVGG